MNPLQPRLQKEIFKVLQAIVESKKQPVILTTHSQHFVRLNNLKDTHLFIGKTVSKTYKRRPNQNFYEVSTTSANYKSNSVKASEIKLHLGISNNDGWELLPYNILVEGEEDKRYLESLFNLLNFPIPNIIWSGGASKIAGYLQYYNVLAKDLDYKPEINCIFDNDNEGREQQKKIGPKTYSNLLVKTILIPRSDGVNSSDFSNADWEIEDFLLPSMILSVINQILKKEGYKRITPIQIDARDQPAHINKTILNFAEECTSQNNSDKAYFPLDDQGRKKQICKLFCEQCHELIKENDLTKIQIEFLSGLLK